MTGRQDRLDGSGRACAGSQLQVQIYVNRRQDELSRQLLQALPSLASLGADIWWVSPLESERFVEYQDRAFLRAVGFDHLAGALRRFWPRGGYSGCQASPTSRDKIEAALGETKHWLGVSHDADWTGPLYQSANRLAHLYFFREIASTPAWLVSVYFLHDPHSPTSREEWQAAIAQVKAELGLTGTAIPHSAELFLQAGDRRELVDA